MKKGITFNRINILYVIVVVLFLTLGNYVQWLHLEAGLFITEFVIIVGIPLLILKVLKADIKSLFPHDPIGVKNYIKVFFISFFSLPVVLFLNLSVMTLLQEFGIEVDTAIELGSTFQVVIIQFLAISVAAGICEELLFRGMLLQSYRRFINDKSAILLTALLFGLLHFNLHNLFGPIFLGAVFGFYVVKFNSIIPAIFGHMLNNGIALVSQLYFNSITTPEMAEAAQEMSMGAALLSMLPSAIIGGAFVFALLHSMRGNEFSKKEKDHQVNFLTTSPLLLAGALYLFVSYYFFFRG